jgi:hypothetical protein
MTGWLISAFERLPGWARSVVVALSALLLIGAAITVLTIGPSTGSGAGRVRPASRVPGRQTTPPPSLRRPAPPVSADQLARVREAAERFLVSYLLFAYGRARELSPSSLTRALGRWLVRQRAQPTPVERRRHPRVVSLRVMGMTPGFALATAIVDDVGLAAYPMLFTLQQGAGGWAVSNVLEG